MYFYDVILRFLTDFTFPKKYHSLHIGIQHLLQKDVERPTYRTNKLKILNEILQKFNKIKQYSRYFHLDNFVNFILKTF